MIPNTAERQVTSNGVVESGMFGISANDTAHIMGILRDTLYSDKILAVIREYSTNAWDAHRDAGMRILPIKITLPTYVEPTLVIRDYGKGLSKEDVFKIYTQYGASTKRTTDDAVGMLGIGSKSGFAYADSFTVTSYHGGFKRLFVAALDKSEKGIINLLHEEPSTETGVEISIAVKPNDISEFERKAKTLLKYFNPRPEINAVIPDLPKSQKELVNGVIFSGEEEDRDAYYHEREWVAVMGCIPYRINLEQLINFEEGVARFLQGMSGALFFNIGEVQISASREELKYSDATKRALINKFNALTEEFVKSTLDGIEQANVSIWEKKVRAQILNKLKLPIPVFAQVLTEEHIKFVPELVPETLEIYRGKDLVRYLPVADGVRLIIKDDFKALTGYSLDYKCYMVRREDKKTDWDVVQKDLEMFTEFIGAQGIPIQRLSTLPWVAPNVKTKVNGVDKRKHAIRSFKFNPDHKSYGEMSDRWTIEERTPTKDDVYVRIYRFEVEGFQFWHAYARDRSMAEIFGIPFLDAVYGYKVSKNEDGVTKKDEPPLGIHYLDWQQKFYESFANDDTRELLRYWEWKDIIHPQSSSKLKEFVSALGKRHPIVMFIRKHVAGIRYINRVEKKAPEKLKRINDLKTAIRGKVPVSEAMTEAEALHARYPLFSLGLTHALTGIVDSTNGPKWLHYIKLIDSQP